MGDVGWDGQVLDGLREGLRWGMIAVLPMLMLLPLLLTSAQFLGLSLGI